MALRISNAELNSLLYAGCEGNGGYDAGFTNDPAMDEYLRQQEVLDDIDMELQFGNVLYDDRLDHKFHDQMEHDMDDYYSTAFLIEVVETFLRAWDDRAIGEIIAKNKEELFHVQ